MAFGRDVLPAGANIDDPEPEPVADLVTTPRSVRIDALVSNSFGFGGHNAAVVFKRA